MTKRRSKVWDTRPRPLHKKHPGWVKESKRHSQAAKGIKTGRKTQGHHSVRGIGFVYHKTEVVQRPPHYTRKSLPPLEPLPPKPTVPKTLTVNTEESRRAERKALKMSRREYRKYKIAQYKGFIRKLDIYIADLEKELRIALHEEDHNRIIKARTKLLEAQKLRDQYTDDLDGMTNWANDNPPLNYEPAKVKLAKGTTIHNPEGHEPSYYGEATVIHVKNKIGSGYKTLYLNPKTGKYVKTPPEPEKKPDFEPLKRPTGTLLPKSEKKSEKKSPEWARTITESGKEVRWDTNGENGHIKVYPSKKTKKKKKKTEEEQKAE